MECPNPQPGQKPKPKFLIGHSEKCDSEGFIKANQINPPIQKNNSMFSFRNISFDATVARFVIRCSVFGNVTFRLSFLSSLSVLCGCKGGFNSQCLFKVLHEVSVLYYDQEVLTDGIKYLSYKMN